MSASGQVHVVSPLQSHVRLIGARKTLTGSTCGTRASSKRFWQSRYRGHESQNRAVCDRLAPLHLRFPPIHRCIVDLVDGIRDTVGGAKIQDCLFALRDGEVVINDDKTTGRDFWIERIQGIHS